MRLPWILLLLAALTIVRAARAETLRQVLEKNGVPLAGFQPAELGTEVSSGVVAAADGQVLLAFPTQGEGQAIGAPLHVVLYRRAAKAAIHRAIPADETSSVCFGSALEIFEQAGFLLVETHINPSASCTLVLDASLKVRRTLFGWRLAQLGPNTMLMHEDRVHFVSTHSARLAVVDLGRNETQEVYPPDGDPLRAAYSKDLKSHLPPQETCAARNWGCDPDTFEEDLVNPVFADASTGRFAFVMTYAPDAFGDEAERAIGRRSVLYVYRRSAEGWTYCQQELSDQDIKSRMAALEGDFQAQVKGCATESVVKVAPKDSPFTNP